jgi:hypothetical protein
MLRTASWTTASQCVFESQGLLQRSETVYSSYYINYYDQGCLDMVLTATAVSPNHQDGVRVYS